MGLIIFPHLSIFLAEKQGRYHIEWEDHPVTGKTYKPTWEPKANANQEAIDSWEAEKGMSDRFYLFPSSP